MHDRQAHADPLAYFLGGKEPDEEPRQHFRLMPLPVSLTASST
jgi:hypothetical protein